MMGVVRDQITDEPSYVGAETFDAAIGVEGRLKNLAEGGAACVQRFLCLRGSDG